MPVYSTAYCLLIQYPYCTERFAAMNLIEISHIDIILIC